MTDERHYTMTDLTAAEVETVARGRFKVSKAWGYLMIGLLGLSLVLFLFAIDKETQLIFKVMAMIVAMLPFGFLYLTFMRPQARYAQDYLATKAEVTKK